MPCSQLRSTELGLKLSMFIMLPYFSLVFSLVQNVGVLQRKARGGLGWGTCCLPQPRQRGMETCPTAASPAPTDTAGIIYTTWEHFG